MSELEKNAVKITVTYDDGTVKDLEKGLVWFITEIPEKEQVEISAEMIAMSGKDLFTVVNAAIEMGVRLGMFNDLEDEP